MADKKKDRNKGVKDIAKQLRRIGISGPDLAALVDAAVRGDWGISEFVVRVTRTDSFQRKFPGLIKGGNINPAISGAFETGITVSSLGKAIQAYETMLKGYTDVAKQYGYTWGREKMQTALQADTSVDELGARLAAIHTVSANKDTFEAWQKQAKMAGQDFDPFRLALKLNDRGFFDTLEAAQLQTQVGLKAKDAAKAAGSVGLPGTYDQRSLDEIIGYVRQNLSQVGPELGRQGINAVKLVKVIGNPGAFAKEMDIIRQTVATREGLARPVAGSYANRGSGGGLSLYEDEGSASYG